MTFKAVSTQKNVDAPAPSPWQEICNNTGKELVVGLAIAAATAPFMTSVGTTLILTKTVNIVCASAVRRCIAVYNRHSIEHTEQIENKSFITSGRLFAQKSINIYLNWTNAYKFTRLTDNADTLIHEMGHYTVFKTLCEGAVGIEVFPFGGGVTSWTFEKFTALGAFLGDETVVKLIFAAGVGFSLTASLACIGAAHYYQDTKPELSRYLNAAAIWCIFSSTLYAISALFEDPSPGHDFAALASVGIFPLTAARYIIGIPMIFKIALREFVEPEKNLRPMGVREVTSGKLRKDARCHKTSGLKESA